MEIDRLGPYEVHDKLGEGGMGEVYLAHDPRLKRDVAIKLLPADLAADPERLARLQREAQVLASLEHPNVAAVYGLEEADGVRFLVMQRAEGETLADRIARGPLPADEVIAIALQIAEGLEAAHERGVVHRDLKPANVMVAPDGGVKILDFGLAKAYAADGTAAASSPDLTASPTVLEATRAGVIMGTASYMSPEQARGRPVDKRTDIWAFGCVLYEMLTGERPFQGETVTDTLAAVVKEEPGLERLPRGAPAVLHLMVRRCLEKDPRQRLRDIGEARLLLGGPDPERFGLATTSPEATGGPRAWMVAALAVVAASSLLLAAWTLLSEAPTAVEPLRVAVPLPTDRPLSFDSAFRSLSVSPDGRTVAYSAIEQSVARIHVQDLGSFDPRVLEGTEGGTGPFFSPDGAWIGYFVYEALYKIPTQGGPPQQLADRTVWNRDALWLDKETIVLGGESSASTDRGLRAISTEGGEIRVLTEPDAADEFHADPRRLPDGSVVFGIVGGSRERLGRYWPAEERWQELSISGVVAWWLDGGYLIVADRTGQLQARRFDLATGEVSGTPLTVLEGADALSLSVAPVGTAAYVEAPPAEATVVAVDREGRATPLLAQTGGFRWPRVSPDGERIALGVTSSSDRARRIWVLEIETGRRTVLGEPLRMNTEPVWSPDGTRILTSSELPPGLVLHAADGSRPMETLLEPGFDPWPTDWSSDGGHMIFYGQRDPESAQDIFYLEVESDPDVGTIEVGDPRLAAGGPGQQRLASLSPDGSWLAYSSDESGSLEVYLQPFPELDRRWTVSAAGGWDPQWSPDGSEIYYRFREAIYAVPVETEPAVSLGAPELLFSGRYARDPNGDQSWDVMPDGRFVLIESNAGARSEIRLVTGLEAEIREGLER